MNAWDFNAENKLLARQRLKALLPLWISLPGIISIYYGDEVGVDGFKDPFNRKNFHWDDIDESILGIYLQVLKVKKRYSALRTSSFKNVYFSNQTFGCIRENDEEIVITITNFGNDKQEFKRTYLDN